MPRSEIITYAGDKSGKFTEAPATGDWAERVKQAHERLIEYIAEADDTLMEKWMEKGSLTEDELRGGLHAALQQQSFIPVFCTSAEHNIGVARLMDMIAKYGSSPVDRKTVPALDAGGKDCAVDLAGSETVCYVFKTMSEAQFGELSFFRVYSGQVKFGSELYNPDRRVSEKIGQIYLLNGKNRETGSGVECGRHRGGGETQGHPHRQHVVQRQTPGVAAQGGLSQALHSRVAQEHGQR